jgi:hypothetical protein
MKRSKTVLIAAGALLLLTMFFPGRGNAGVHVGVGINLPAFSFSAPPPLAVIPGTYGYYAPDAGVDIFFYHNYWYRPYEGRWFRSRSYNGPWAHVAPTVVPGFFLNAHPDYRHLSPGHRRIPYVQVKNNWRRWEHERYWDRRGGDRREGHWQHDRRER